MPTLHIVHGDREGDRAWLKKAAGRKKTSHSWIVPKTALISDEAAIFVEGGLFATARIKSEPIPRPDWNDRRYGAQIDTIRLIEPPVSAAVMRQEIPEFAWAKYPRSITTPAPAIAAKILRLVQSRRRRGGASIGDELLEIASLEELRARALAQARPRAAIKFRMTGYRVRSSAVHLYVLRRAQGICEGCTLEASFANQKKEPYLEPHHTRRLADDGPDLRPTSSRSVPLATAASTTPATAKHTMVDSSIS